ncbi:Rx, N-terminal [Dillenia turbinata]|uniref:Rx, N-terminal n=1 Tax=Dillenia turbinata TaxID=194707 RepID=A0AAN8UNU2_9MAGN
MNNKVSMASESIVSLITEELVDMLLQEAKFLGRVKGQVKRIKAELQWMQCFLKDTDEKQEGDAWVKNCVAEIRLVTLESKWVNKESKQQVISIVGMGGHRKGTLAKRLCNNKDEESLRAQVYVSHVYSAKQLLVDIAKKILGFDVGGLIIEQIEERLPYFLKEKRNLTVMDDV